ncbi:sensor domain-containing diguanylate cyclase [Arenimonas composti]|uniref:diguanylate cyclase n=1 Tax=Arenimonas composti TR7-09 = DSM 18010 TaxID=1121013 RepID=A0A091BEN5_9GAMM|nr:diguanylate cyclase [Arenimonas composti]KFN49279.1 hypothetical protein P873_11575 [Arenimonas composti TR7-09 = DSM 18010]
MPEPTNRPPPSLRRPLLAGAALFVAAALAAVFFTQWVVAKGERLERERVIALARTLAAVLDGERIGDLRGTRADTGTAMLAAVRDELRRARAVNPDFRFVYLMRRDRDGTLVFLADAEDPGSADYSAPGDRYDGPSAQILGVWESGVPAVEPPSRDRWGYWVTGLAPVRDGEGEIVAVLGMDVNAHEWLATLARYRAFALAISGLVLLLIVVFTVGLLRQRRAADRLARMNEDLAAHLGELQKAQDRLRALSTTDGLTGLGNRRAFDAAIERLWQHALHHGEPLSLLMGDIDWFKSYNDLYGHVAGDHCLQQVAEALATGVEVEDALVARYGGEEFAVLLPRTDAATAHALAERLRARVEALAIPHQGNPLRGVVTISLGVATRPPPQAPAPDGLVQGADQALYRAKHGGRNAVAVDFAAP